MRKPTRFYGLVRPKLRQSWNKWNFYNLARGVGAQDSLSGTFFQQKWKAKAKARAYHGENISEKKWKRLFSRRLQSAIEMPPQYLASTDGSEQAMGTGSGLENDNTRASSFSRVPGFSERLRPTRIFRPRRTETVNLLNEPVKNMTPHVQMVFAPLERRLDTAVFRALFASSVRQARLFIVHGAVTVNGAKMKYPAYQLNPGDLFQVDVEKVLYATGQQKVPYIAAQVTQSLEARKRREDKFANRTAGEEAVAEDETPEAVAETPELTEEEIWAKNNRTIKYILKDVKKILKSDGKKDLNAKQKKDLRLFRESAKRFLAQPENSDIDAKDLVESLALQMKSHDMMRETFEKFKITEDKAEDTDKTETASAENAENAEGKEASPKPRNNPQSIAKVFGDLSEEQQAKAKRIMGASQLTREEMRNLASILRYDEKNPVDDTKPYATPWRPRPFMSAFAFIPRYLEVNPKICAAVYLRHPVARKGMAEVPTPFNYLTNQLTHNYYLERG
ncbi:hypothetical protein S7711_00747 [Stachybotrys chartarum IBT 7711]|uniref:RNA-binding S4 domain-containing protein n=1 Tax=Stachybotrys chartarum (strain CBS 109288 / IBT 7711) TaxID=1280523 RepID=A0A084B026_STACB|nr:hypothetical protein S7711_00747 [Stachybotrys chartarum IBT 7711]